MIRLLGTENFTYYKTNGHHRNHIRTLARLKDCLSPTSSEEHRGYWAQTPTSHFLFTEQEIESNSFFILKYSTQCLGSYYVDGIQDSVIENFQIQRLTELTHGYGTQAIDNVMSKLEDWHHQHYWKSKKSKKTADAPQDAVTT